MRFFIAVLFQLIWVAKAQIVIRLKMNEGVLPQFKMYLAGSFNQWNPADSQYQFNQSKQGYLLTVPNRIAERGFECKVTGGSWKRAEGGPSGNAIGNRTITPTKNDTILFTVEGWEKQKPLEHTLSPQVVTHQIKYQNQTRNLWVYIPKDYRQQTQKRYPVLYLLDGQNMFDDATSFSGEWGVDETMDDIASAGGQPPIVVAIENGGADRLDEYTPFVNIKGEGGGGKEYARYVVKTVKPFIDSLYRTSVSPQQTAIGGSSLGGLMALYMSVEYPQTFGKALSFSPSIWWSDSMITMLSKVKPQSKQQWCLMAGIHESVRMQPDIQHWNEQLLKQKIAPHQVWIQFDSLGKHNEMYWKSIFRPAFCWLFEDYCKENADIQYDWSKRSLSVFSPNVKSVCFFNSTGEKVQDIVNPIEGKEYQVNPELKGHYLMSIVYKEGQAVLKHVNLP